MLRHHSIQLGPGRFPGVDGSHPRPGTPKPRVLTARVLVPSSERLEGIR